MLSKILINKLAWEYSGMSLVLKYTVISTHILSPLLVITAEAER